MNFFSRYYKRLKLRHLKVVVLAIIISIFFMPSFVPFERDGDNIFTVLLNGTEVGVVADPQEAKGYLNLARKRIASGEDELVLIDSNMETQGREVLFGKIDQPETVVDNMAGVLAGSIHETMQRCYTVKINEYMVNVATKNDVIALLQAAIDKYDTEGKYTVDLGLDSTRELPVLTAQAISTQEAEEQVEQAVALDAGMDAVLTDIFEAVEPKVEKSFEDYDLGLISLNYGDTVEIVEAYLSADEVTPLEQTIDEVTNEQEKNEVYEVVAGDSLSMIAIKTNIPMDKIIEMNDSLEDENSMIRVGDELNITVPEPQLAIERSEELYYEEDYEADIIYIDNDEWYTTETQTLQEPSAGHRKVVAVVSYRNDKEISVEIEKEEITYEAVPKIVERGTIVPPTYLKPISGGRLSSQFGRRSAPTRGASSYHKGVDWATPVGTAVIASSGGVVAKAGWGSGYGYVVYINHPDGKQTRYGHLSKVLVSAGQTVSQGQKIALSGNTGVSTGPHIHFEILVNGSQVNPLKYLN